MRYIIYKITNTLNGKIYIGKHQTERLDDSYFGSGKVLKQAIEKYGKENFIFHLEYELHNQSELELLEKMIVNDDFLKREDVYNIRVGGKGGFESGLWKGVRRSLENRINISNGLKGHIVKESTRIKLRNFHLGSKHSQSQIDKQRNSLKKTLSVKGIWNKGKKCPYLSGVKNPFSIRFKGTHYYNNGSIEIRDTRCPNGFKPGRISRSENMRKNSTSTNK